VELTSVRSKVKETVQALETKYGKTVEPKTPQSPIYSTVNRAAKKNKRHPTESVEARDADADATKKPHEQVSVL
jgi:hypothetical protein